MRRQVRAADAGVAANYAARAASRKRGATAPSNVFTAAGATKASKGAIKGSSGQSTASAWPTPGDAQALGKGKGGAAKLQKQVDELRAQLRKAGRRSGSDEAADEVGMVDEGEADDVTAQGSIDMRAGQARAGSHTFPRRKGRRCSKPRASSMRLARL